MTYLPLARKYRPGTFSDLVGQTAAAEALANAIKLGREPHAVIFTGVRGVGKTTCARLYAKALNCVHGPTPTPCNACESCIAINQGIHEDVVEIDGASNTGVDDVRALRETISYVPQRSKFKVYIVDEVHMLSQSAFNAMLKTLEEPPPHVVFVFATTEFHKIPETIVSRCQLFALKKFSVTDIEERLAKILTLETVPFERDALSVLAREGKGSMRDALTLLDYAIAMGDGQVTRHVVSSVLKAGSSSDYIELLTALLKRDRNVVLKILARLFEQAVEPTSIAEKIASFARHGFIARDVGREHLDFVSLGYTEDESNAIIQMSRLAAPLDLNRIFRTFVKCIGDLEGSELDSYILENYCLEWCLDPGLPNAMQFLSSESTAPQTSAPTAPALPLTEQPDAPKQTLSKAFANIVQAAPQASRQKIEAAPLPTTVPQGNAEFPATWREFVDRWKQMKPLQARKLEELHPVHYSAERIELLIPANSYAATSLLRLDEQQKLKTAFAELFGFKGQLQILSMPDSVGNQPQQSPLPETLAQQRERETENRRSTLEQQTREHPLTKEIVRLFDATIDRIDIHDS